MDAPIIIVVPALGQAYVMDSATPNTRQSLMALPLANSGCFWHDGNKDIDGEVQWGIRGEGSIYEVDPIHVEDWDMPFMNVMADCLEMLDEMHRDLVARNKFRTLLQNFQEAARRLQREWESPVNEDLIGHGLEISGYPDWMPSFDEALAEILAMNVPPPDVTQLEHKVLGGGD